MQIEPEILLRNVPEDRKEAIERDVIEWIGRLEKFHPRITRCRVVVERSGARHHRGNLYHVRADITVPGGEIIVGRDPAAHHTHEDPHVAVRDAFHAARRRLEDHAREQSGRVKAHEPPPHGRIKLLLPASDCGFIEALDGREIYFHRHAVVDGSFDRLAVGDQVTFVEEAGEKGPQASTVRVLGRHHHIVG